MSVLLDMKKSRTHFLKLQLILSMMDLKDRREELELDIVHSSSNSIPKIVRFKTRMHVFFSRKIARLSTLERMLSWRPHSHIRSLLQVKNGKVIKSLSAWDALPVRKLETLKSWVRKLLNRISTLTSQANVYRL